jgi:hypothetical protein
VSGATASSLADLEPSKPGSLPGLIAHSGPNYSNLPFHIIHTVKILQLPCNIWQSQGSHKAGCLWRLHQPFHV